MLQNYLLIGLFVAIATLFPFLAVGVAWLLRPKKPTPMKQSTYECGLETIGETWVRYKVQFYIYALVFVLFDIETVFLFPWAVAYHQLPLFALVEMFLFIGILLAGLAYAWRKGALQWS